jgi:hypothetical protein
VAIESFKGGTAMFDVKDTVVDEAALAEVQRQIQANATDPRTAPDLERTWTIKNQEVQLTKAAQAAAEREADECQAQLDSVMKATDKLRKVGSADREVAKLEKKISELRDRLTSARESADRNKRIAKARKETMENWLQERFRNGPTNLEVIEAARERDRALAAAGV